MHSVKTVLAMWAWAWPPLLLPIIPAKAFSSAGNPLNPSTSSVKDGHMGPAAFMWPPDRVWSSDMDNKAPCGSRAAAGTRTKFPLTAGAVALVAQDDYYSSKISISYSNDPTMESDFTLVEMRDISDLNPGHTCASIPDAPARVTPGTNATLQVTYQADWDKPYNQTFYACADIVYVAAASFKYEQIPCFNATEPGEDDKASEAKAGEAKDAPIKAPDKPASESQDVSGASGTSHMGSGAVAGAVVGSLASASLAAATGVVLHRRRNQKKRALRLARIEENARLDQCSSDKLSS